MLIINSDDWGRSVAETDAALGCYKKNRITSASAMVFMVDSKRAADLAQENKLDVGLHLNFTEKFTGNTVSAKLGDCQDHLIRFLKGNKYSQLLFNPFLREHFSNSFKAQFEEFARLYGKAPSHIDGHHHMHLCANMVVSALIPSGTKIRRNFSFWPGEKSLLNRTYRACVDRQLARKYRLTDYFFDLSQSVNGKKMDRVAALATQANVELMTHPILKSEMEYLAGDEFFMMTQRVQLGSYGAL
jgi:predicted glycoside hydrolase/deacetylase ChbG (UPF0249 family)